MLLLHCCTQLLVKNVSIHMHKKQLSYWKGVLSLVFLTSATYCIHCEIKLAVLHMYLWLYSSLENTKLNILWARKKPVKIVFVTDACMPLDIHHMAWSMLQCQAMHLCLFNVAYLCKSDSVVQLLEGIGKRKSKPCILKGDAKKIYKAAALDSHITTFHFYDQKVINAIQDAFLCHTFRC